ncbi:hypothetical protein [Actinoplanes sp. G11-F43]|uniref:hypothetical protein n=1 Tax=Actinoplanes sp. G11-F43 TaxID=3424130 RepID=UPI003D3593C3
MVLGPGRTGDYDPAAPENADDGWSGALLPEPGIDLITAAHDALRAVATPGSVRFTDWIHGDEAEAAHLARIADVLASAR